MIKLFETPFDLARGFAEDFAGMVNESASAGQPFYVALSGGNTPKLLFSILAEKYSESVRWDNVHFFWGDERCVSPDDPESNYGAAKKILFDKIVIPSENIHRIMGENDPSKEAVRYSSEIKRLVNFDNGWPVFSLMLLGIGEDGHTASIFPGREDLLTSEKICEEAIHPVSLQERITITGKVINNSETTIILVSGKNKAKVFSDIINKTGSVSYPVAAVHPAKGGLIWYVEKEAAASLGKNVE